MFNFEEANKILQCEESEICLPLVKIEGISIEEAISQIKQQIDIQPLINQAEGYQIANVEQATQALSMALQARKLLTALIESKKEITRPNLDFQKSINKLVSDYTSKLDEIENNLKDKITDWIDTNTQEGYSSGLDSIQVPDGSLKRVTSWDFDVEDTKEIPIEYLCADLEGIERAIKGGIRNIPGVKIYAKTEIKLRVKN